MKLRTTTIWTAIGAASSSAGSEPIAALINLKGNGLAIAKDTDASGCIMAVR